MYREEITRSSPTAQNLVRRMKRSSLQLLACSLFHLKGLSSASQTAGDTLSLRVTPPPISHPTDQAAQLTHTPTSCTTIHPCTTSDCGYDSDTITKPATGTFCASCFCAACPTPSCSRPSGSHPIPTSTRPGCPNCACMPWATQSPQW